MIEIIKRIFSIFFGITRNTPIPSNTPPSNTPPSNTQPSNPITSLAKKKPPKTPPKKDNIVL